MLERARKWARGNYRMKIRKSYKETRVNGVMEKRGQVTIFIIVAIVIVAVFLAFLVYPRVRVLVSSDVNPSSYLKACLEPELEDTLGVLVNHGGYYEPTNYVLYKGEKIQYLCYTAENYKPCIVQQPLLVRHVEQELKAKLGPKARQCMNDLKVLYEQKGYQVSGLSGEINVSIVPDKIFIQYDTSLIVSKEQTQTFRQLEISKDSKIYDLLLTATSIVQFESTLGDSETLLYVQFYPDLIIEKLKKEGDTIYTLRNVVSEDKFTFATRSLVWPSGYGVIQNG